MWNGICVNLISDVVFIVVLLLLFGILWYWPALIRARKFFGIGKHDEINIYISVHEDNQTTTRKVVTVEEYEAADYLRRTINRQIKDSVFGRLANFLSGLIGLDPKIPEIKIVADDLENIKATGAAFAIGGPVRNKMTKSVIENSNPWICYNVEEEKFQIAKGQRKSDFIEHSGKLSIIEKIIVDECNLILAYGFGETHTRIAVEYLAENWRKLYKKYKQEPFVLCFIQDAVGEIEIVEESVGR